MSDPLLPPLPEPDTDSAAFFAGLAEGRLLIQRCGACGAAQLAKHMCTECGGEDLTWVPASGRGRIYSFTRIHLAYHPAFAGTLPYAAALVELEEGPRLYGAMADVDPAQVDVGVPVRVDIRQVSDGRYAPYFKPAPADAS